MSDLKTKSYRGAFWSGVDAVGERLVRFVIGVILARLLLPEQFGLIGMLAIFIGIMQALLDSGFSAALIQKDKLTEVDTSSVFYFNVGFSIILAALLYLSAPWIAEFYGVAILASITRAMSLIVVINAFSVVQTAVLTREMNFKAQTKVSLVASLCSGSIGVAFAYRGFGVWSLVALQLSGAITRSILLWVSHTWRPRLTVSISALRDMLRFGSRLLAAGVLSQAFRDIYYVVIGRLYNPAALGFYARAKHMEELPSMTLSRIVSRVAFPAFSCLQNDEARLRRGLRKALKVVMLFNAPLLIGLLVVAEPMVLILLTDRWLPSVQYLQLLCVVGLIYPLHALNLNILMAKGRSDLFLRIEIIKKILVVINIAILWRWGISALIVGQIVAALLSYLLNSFYTGKSLRYGAGSQLKDVSVYLVFSVIMGLGAYSLIAIPFPNELVLLLAQITVGFIIYLLLCITFRPSAYIEVLALLRCKLKDTSGTPGSFARMVLAAKPKAP